MSLPTAVACIGGGLIGGGWAARFVLNGVDVAVFDPDPQSERRVRAILTDAQAAFGKLIMAPLPKPGRLRFAATVAGAVEGAELIQESVPERLEVKQAVLAEIDAAAPPTALIGSSTSGLLPTDLQAGLGHPERLFVAHPYNPVYLLPLVELVAGGATAARALERAAAVYQAVGMKAVPIAKEIAAFVGDRLMEALWREALWLVHDDIATIETIDDVMRLSFGLRWAQMGLFQTYRIAGGEAGMDHFMAQFGPTLSWPWSKLTDVPRLTDGLIETIVAQSDAQARGRSIRDLEGIRDDNLVAILQALRAGNGGDGWGAGAVLKAYEDRLHGRAAAAAAADDHDLRRPLRLVETRVAPAWIDYNGHMTEHRYLQVFGDASDALLRLIGVDQAYVASGRSYFTVETHIMHLDEVRAGEAIHTTTQLLASDAKRLHLFHRIHHGASGAEIASAEQMLLHVDGNARKACPATPAVLAALGKIATAHQALPRPAAAGRHVGQRR
jgi:carnitine 3-dehydrogenase